MVNAGRIIVGLAVSALLAASAAYGACEVVFLGYDDSSVYCNCNTLDNMCHGGGMRVFILVCEGPCDNACLGCTQGDVTIGIVGSTPICEDTGWWPPGSECNEDADCEITGWTDQEGEVITCKCDAIWT
jgi:hypothetical protein